MTITLSPDAQTALRHYLEWRSMPSPSSDKAAMRQYEEARSYASEFVACVLRANPELAAKLGEERAT